MMVLWYTYTYIKPNNSFMHTWWSYVICTHISNLVIPSCTHVGVWYTHTYIKPYYSFMHTWWSYDIHTPISNLIIPSWTCDGLICTLILIPIIPSCKCDGLKIYAHVYQTQTFLHAHVMVLLHTHTYIYTLVYSELVNALDVWTVLCWSPLRKDCPPEKGLSIRTPGGFTVWHVHRQHCGLSAVMLCHWSKLHVNKPGADRVGMGLGATSKLLFPAEAVVPEYLGQGWK